MKYTDQPAFPPQVAQDNLGRIIAPIPGMTKLEFFAIMLLPKYLDIAKKYDGIILNGEKVSAFDAAIEAARIIIEKINKSNDETTPVQIIE